VLMQSATRIDVVMPLKALGLDSLMALEFRNRLEAGLGLTLPATLVWNYPTLTALATHLATKLEIPLDAPAGQVPGGSGLPEGVLADVNGHAPNDQAPNGHAHRQVGGHDARLRNLEQLSEDAVEKMLTDELAEIDDLLRRT
jgi:acyl carrier protein